MKRYRKGFSLIEFVVAASLILGVFLTGALALDSSRKIDATIRAKTSATALGYEVLDKAKLYKCGTVSVPLLANENVCGLNTATPASGLQNRVVADTCTNDKKTNLEAFKTELQNELKTATGETVTLKGSEEGSVCRSNTVYYWSLNYELDNSDGTAITQCNVNTRPTLIRYTLDMTWITRNQVKTETLTTTEPLPAKFREDVRAVAVPLTTAKVHEVFLNVTPAQGAVVKSQTLYSDSSCAWFLDLPLDAKQIQSVVDGQVKTVTS